MPIMVDQLPRMRPVQAVVVSFEADTRGQILTRTQPHVATIVRQGDDICTAELEQRPGHLEVEAASLFVGYSESGTQVSGISVLGIVARGEDHAAAVARLGVGAPDIAALWSARCEVATMEARETVEDLLRANDTGFRV